MCRLGEVSRAERTFPIRVQNPHVIHRSLANLLEVFELIASSEAPPPVAWRFPSMLPLLASPRADVFLPCLLCALCHIALTGLVASCDVGTSCRQRPALRAGAHTRPPMLSASVDERRQACGRRPHLSDGFCQWPGNLTGRLHQHHGLGVTPHRNTAEASLRAAPSGIPPGARKRHRAMSHFRATATSPMRLTRFPPPPKRSRHQQLRALSG